jgi:sulfur carrier protein
MNIEVNGEARDIVQGATIRALLIDLGLGDVLVAVERNELVVPRAAHMETTLEAGDRIEVVHFVGGG